MVVFIWYVSLIASFEADHKISLEIVRLGATVFFKVVGVCLEDVSNIS